MRAVSVRCPAKVNLHLQVLGRRGDGYHELRTVFAAVGVWDVLEAVPAPDGRLSLEVRPEGAVGSGPDNLVLRAAEALRRRSGVTAGAAMVLHKSIPVAGGLGGGSSDAAAALAALACLWGLDGGFAALHGVAAGLGADVPFFLLGGAAWGVGRGDEVLPLPDLPPWWVVLLPGREPVSTAEVYRRLDAGGVDAGPVPEVYQWVVTGGRLPLSACRNDLEPAVVEGWPEVGRRLSAVGATDALLARVSGSGGTVFGLFADEASAARAARALESWRPVVAPLLSRETSVVRPPDREDTWTSQRSGST